MRKLYEYQTESMVGKEVFYNFSQQQSVHSSFSRINSSLSCETFH